MLSFHFTQHSQKRREAERVAAEKKLQEMQQEKLRSNGTNGTANGVNGINGLNGINGTNGAINKAYETAYKKNTEYTETHYTNGGSNLTKRNTASVN